MVKTVQKGGNPCAYLVQELVCTIQRDLAYESLVNFVHENFNAQDTSLE